MKSWKYFYSQNKGGWNENRFGEKDFPEPLSGLFTIPINYDLVDLRSTTVIAADGSKSVHAFNRKWGYLEGQEVVTEIYGNDGSSILQRIEKNLIKYTQEAI